MANIVPLRKVRGSTVRMVPATTVELLLELEARDWEMRALAGQFVVNAHGGTIEKPLRDRIEAEKRNLLRLVRYCEAIQEES